MSRNTYYLHGPKLRDKSLVRVGQILTSWYDTGALGPTITYFKVVKVNRVTIDVLSEQGRVQRCHPEVFERALDPEHSQHDRELIAELKFPQPAN